MPSSARVMMEDVMAETLLLGWEGITQDGKPVPYSREQARTYLRIKDFRKKIAGFSDNFEAFRAKAEAEQGKD